MEFISRFIIITPFKQIIFRVSCLRFRVLGWGLGFELGVGVLGFGFQVSGVGLAVRGLGGRVSGFGFWVSGFKFWVWIFGFRV